MRHFRAREGGGRHSLESRIGDSQRGGGVVRTMLAGLVGAVLGGIAALGLAMWGVGGWVSWLTIGVGTVAGCFYGDRGIAALARVIAWF